MNASFQHLQYVYDAMWQDAQVALPQRQALRDPVPEEGSSRWGLSAIIRPTGVVAERLVATANELHPLAGSDQLVYATHTLHTTIRSFECYRSKIPPDDRLVQSYVEIVAQIASRFDAFPIHYHGLTATRAGILAQGWPMNGKLQEFRSLLHQGLQARQLLAGPEGQARKIRETAHASLMVFTAPIVDPIALVQSIAQRRRLDFGVTTATAIDLVRYRRTPSTVEQVVLATAPLGSS